MEEHPNLPYTSLDLEDLASVYFARCFILFRSDPLRRIAFERINLPSLFIRVLRLIQGEAAVDFVAFDCTGQGKKAHGHVVHDTRHVKNGVKGCRKRQLLSRK
jgi:hypothetical protein